MNRRLIVIPTSFSSEEQKGIKQQINIIQGSNDTTLSIEPTIDNTSILKLDSSEFKDVSAYIFYKKEFSRGSMVRHKLKTVTYDSTTNKILIQLDESDTSENGDARIVVEFTFNHIVMYAINIEVKILPNLLIMSRNQNPISTSSDEPLISSVADDMIIEYHNDYVEYKGICRDNHFKLPTSFGKIIYFMSSDGSGFTLSGASKNLIVFDKKSPMRYINIITGGTNG